MTEEQELLDYDETDDAPQQTGVKGGTANGSGASGVQNGGLTGTQGGPIRGSYVSIHASGFKDFLLKPELLRAIMDCGFEHPSEGEKINKKKWADFILFRFILVQHESIPQAILGTDIVCQAKSGMGKTAVFVLATLQQLEPVDGQVKISFYFFFKINLQWIHI